MFHILVLPCHKPCVSGNRLLHNSNTSFSLSLHFLERRSTQLLCNMLYTPHTLHIHYAFSLIHYFTVRETQEKWSWVQAENDKIQALLQLKSSGDEKFKAKNFKAALLSYSNAVKVSVCVCTMCIMCIVCIVIFCVSYCTSQYFWKMNLICDLLLS